MGAPSATYPSMEGAVATMMYGNLVREVTNLQASLITPEPTPMTNSQSRSHSWTMRPNVFSSGKRISSPTSKSSSFTWENPFAFNNSTAFLPATS